MPTNDMIVAQLREDNQRLRIAVAKLLLDIRVVRQSLDAILTRIRET